MLGAGAWLVVQQELTRGAMIAGSIILSRALAPIERAIGTWKQFIDARMAYQRLTRHFTEPLLRSEGMRLPAPCGHLRLEQVSFFAPGTNRVLLKNVSFEMASGDSLGIMGPSAAGKSTLARLIVGICAPTAGHVRLDGADVFALDRTDLGRHTGNGGERLRPPGEAGRDAVPRHGYETVSPPVALR
jgi:ABC-type protease/lipase transport system fused ATPase/permease subunit